MWRPWRVPPRGCMPFSSFLYAPLMTNTRGSLFLSSMYYVDYPEIIKVYRQISHKATDRLRAVHLCLPAELEIIARFRWVFPT